MNLVAPKKELEAKLRELVERGKGWARKVLDGEVKADMYIQEFQAENELQEAQVRMEVGKIDGQLRHLKDDLVETEVVKEALLVFAETFGELTPDEQKAAIRMLVNQVMYWPDRLECCMKAEPSSSSWGQKTATEAETGGR